MKMPSLFIEQTREFLRRGGFGTVPALCRKSALVLAVAVSMLLACGGGSASTPTANDYTALGNPELVTVTGYSGDIMEPFISRDGAYLFFNDNGSNKNIYYATSVNATTFQYAGAITAINTAAVEGTPTMDVNNKFYYISTANYSPPTAYDTLYGGVWTGSTVTGSAPLAGLAIATPGSINFDIEVSRDGKTIYFDDGTFSGNTYPDTADIAIAVDSGSGFARIPNSSTIMANVNTANLEYAPAISADGLELFFTRLDLNSMGTGIYRVARTSTSVPFGTPQLVSAITGFVEGPALSPDEKSLYYHKLNTSSGKFELYRVTRP
jgi:hypothetical protein